MRVVPSTIFLGFVWRTTPLKYVSVTCTYLLCKNRGVSCIKEPI